MADKEKNGKKGFFTLRHAVFLSIIFTCIVSIGNIAQDIFFDMQAPEIIEVTREIMVGIVVTSTPAPMTAVPPTPTYPYGQIPCSLDRLKEALEQGGIVVFDCNNVILVDEPLVIRNRVHLQGSSEILTTLSQSQNLSTLFIIEAGGTLTLENIAVRDIHGKLMEVHAGGEFFGRNCRFANNGNPSYEDYLIEVMGSFNLAQCVLENNRIARGALIRFEAGATAHIQSSVFRANVFSPEDFTGEGIVIDNNGATVNINASYFLDTLGQNASNWIILARSGETNISGSVFRNNSLHLGGSIIENGPSSMMYIEGISSTNNAVISNIHLLNHGNLRIPHVALFSGACRNTGVLTDLQRICG